MRRASAVVLTLAVLVLTQSLSAQEREPEFLTQLRKLAPKGAFTMIVEVQVKKGEEGAMIAAARPCVEATRKEKGCITYDLQQDLQDPTLFIFYERWQSIKALESHLAAEHTKKLIGSLGKILEGPPKARFYRMTDAK